MFRNTSRKSDAWSEAAAAADSFATADLSRRRDRERDRSPVRWRVPLAGADDENECAGPDAELLAGLGQRTFHATECPLCETRLGTECLLLVSDGSVPTCVDHRLCVTCTLGALGALANSFPSELGPIQAQPRCLQCGPAGGRGRSSECDLRHMLVELARPHTLTRTGPELFAETLLAKLDTARAALSGGGREAAAASGAAAAVADCTGATKACPACGTLCVREGGCPTIRCPCWHIFRECCSVPAHMAHSPSCPAEIELARVFVDVELVFRARGGGGGGGGADPRAAAEIMLLPPLPAAPPRLLADHPMTDAVLMQSS